ncbi:MAG: DUF3987 domain-containing protein [Planctomycetes bacterium]|nr:DUF3987 domain-containing protein [Planctomycetota bacterium]
MITILNIAGDALEAWKNFHNMIETEMRNGGRFEGLRDWASKLPGAVARIAAAMHHFENHERELGTYNSIPAETVDRAITIGLYLAEHALCVLQSGVHDEIDDLMVSILEWAELNDKTEFSHHDLKQRFRNVEEKDLRLALARLSADQRVLPIRPSTEKKPGRRPSLSWRVVPREIVVPAPLPASPLETPRASESTNQDKSGFFREVFAREAARNNARDYHELLQARLGGTQ